MRSKSYCSYFWNHLCIGPNNRMKVCCRFDLKTTEVTALGDNLEKSFNSPLFKKLRDNALSGKANSGCSKCYKQEESLTPSLRERANDCAGPQVFSDTQARLADVKTVEVFVGDTCNLKCVMCGPDASSLWRKDYDRLGWPMQERSQSSLEKMAVALGQLPQLEEVKFVGGEPLLVENHRAILESLSDISENVSLTYFTNATVLPSVSLIEDWKKFKRVNLYLSIDAVGALNEYIRFPSRWKTVEQSVDYYMKQLEDQENLKIFFFSTVSILNIWQLPELADWCANKVRHLPVPRQPRLICNPLDSPSFLAIDNIPKSNRANLIDSLSGSGTDLKRVINWLQSHSEIDRKQDLKTYLNSLDRVRGTSAKSLLPELADIVDLC